MPGGGRNRVQFGAVTSPAWLAARRNAPWASDNARAGCAHAVEAREYQRDGKYW
jgi:hypothetical protein